MWFLFAWILAVGYAAFKLMDDPFLQIAMFWIAIKAGTRSIYGRAADATKSLLVAISIVSILRLTRRAWAVTMENFVVDWGLDVAPMRCGGLVDDPAIVPPTQTASCDIWSDPERIIDRRVELALAEIDRKSDEIERYLRMNEPDAARADSQSSGNV